MTVKNLTLFTWWKRLYDHLVPFEKLILAWLVVLLLGSGLWSVIAYFGRHTQLVPQAGGVYREAAVGQPRHLNPILARASDLDTDISQLVYSSLFKLDSELNLQNDLATEFEISEDKKTYTVKIRSDIHWHDGEPLTADDVIFTIRSIQTPDYGSPLETDFQGVTVEKIDDHTVSFQLQQPYAPFISSLTVGIVPEHVWSSIAPANAALAEQMLKPVGSGPYQFSELKTRRRTGEITEFHLSRNEGYYGQRQYIDEVIFFFYNSHEEALDSLTNNQVDGVSFLPLQLLPSARNRASLDIHRLSLPQYFGLFFNQNKGEILSDSGLRNALALAINRDQIVEQALQGEGESLYLPIPPGIFEFNDELAEPQFNPDAARQNLEEAGWTDVDGDGIREKDNQRLHLTLTTTDWPEYVRTAELIQQAWLDIGIETEIKHFGAGSIQQTVIRPRDYEILLFGEILSPIPDPYPFWHSTQIESPGLNFALFSDPTVDTLLEEARQIHDLEERRQKYKDFQGKILELTPAIVLYRPHYLYVTSDTVHGQPEGYAGHPSGRFNNIENWYVKTKRVWR